MMEQDHLTVDSDLKLLNQVQQWFENFCLQHLSKLSWSEAQLYRLNLALAEGFTNAVRHAHQALPPETTIDIDLALWSKRIENQCMMNKRGHIGKTNHYLFFLACS